MSSPVARRRRDRLIAAGLALLTVIAGAVVYLTSDARATTVIVGPNLPAPAVAAAPPASLATVWTLTSSFPAVVSPYGTVVSSDEHTVTGHDGVTGEVRWSYSRTNLPLCVLASGDTVATTIGASGAVRGILTGYAKNGRCSEITTLDPTTGRREDQRNAGTPLVSTPVFGGPYGGLISADLVELWRYDLVRTIQYGNQVERTKPNTQHLGCEFTDIAVATNQFGTIEHCAATSPNALLVLNFCDPGATADGKSKGWDQQNFDPRATVDLGTAHARLLSVTADQAAVLVADPVPAVVVYDATGTEVSRRPVDISADQIVAAESSRVTPVVIGEASRFVLVGDTLIAVANDGLDVTWTMPGVLGKPVLGAGGLLVPTEAGISVVAAATGVPIAAIPIDRAGYAGRVDLGIVGSTIVETRGTNVIGLRDPAGPATDPPATGTSLTTTVGGRPTRLPTLPVPTATATS